MQSPTGERPEPPVMCCGAFQADERHFVYDEACQAWKCALKAAVTPPEPPTATSSTAAGPPKPTKPATRKPPGRRPKSSS